MSMFKRAERRQLKLKLALTGVAGSGKTFSSLLIASGLGNKIAVIDTENKSANVYVGREGIPAFDLVEIEPPYTVEKYLAAIEDAQKSGYDVLIIDSLSHCWAGSGGLLDQKEAIDARGRGNSYTNWAAITKIQEAFKAKILAADIHIIGTMRSKQEYVQAEENGKKVIKKLGLAPIQRDGIEYEFTTVLDMASNNTAESTKDRTGLFSGKIFKPTKQTGIDLKNWLETGVVVSMPTETTPTPGGAGGDVIPPVPQEWHPGEKEKDELDLLCLSKDWTRVEIVNYIKSHWKIERVSLLDQSQYNQLKYIMEQAKFVDAMKSLNEKETA